MLRAGYQPGLTMVADSSANEICGYNSASVDKARVTASGERRDTLVGRGIPPYNPDRRRTRDLQ